MRDPLDPGTFEMPLVGGAGALVGYARVSTGDQDVGMQRASLVDAGCSKIFEDVASGAKADRPGLDAALSYLRPGDTLLVWKIDRLGRSLAHLIQVIDALRAKGIGFRSLTNSGMNTDTPDGILMFSVFAALAEFERELTRERTREGIRRAKEQGTPLGRRKALTPAKLKKARGHIATGLTVRDAAKLVGVGKTALYHALRSPSEGRTTE